MSRIIKDVKDFDVDHIFGCGQCFRWDRQDDGSWTGIACGKIVNVSQQPPSDGAEQYPQTSDDTGTHAQTHPCCGRIIIDNADEEDWRDIWYDYFDMGRDYGQIKRELAARDSVIRRAIDYGSGIRILRQEPWETMISFIISQNSNIPRIKKNIRDLADLFGDEAGEYRDEVYHILPGPEKLASLKEADLAPVRLGYRAKYLIRTAQQVAAGEEIDPCTLTGFCGVGPKVANCISLFSLDCLHSFPIDTWVKQVMHRLYGIDESDTRAMAEYAQKTFGEYGGIAQQYLFYYIRENA